MGDKKRKSGGDFVPEKTSCPQQDQRAVEALAAVVRKNPLLNLCIVILLKANYHTPKHSL